MKKILPYGFVLIAFTACKSSVTGGYKLSDVLQKKLLHSVIGATDKCSTDSAKSGEIKHFDFFLKDGFAKKFGL